MERQQEISLRNEYIKNLNVFLTTAKNVLGKTLDNLNWTESATIYQNAKPLVTCPLDAGHRLPPDKVEEHLEMCRWHRLGYRDDDVPFPPPPANLPISSVVIDKTALRDLILRAAQNNPSIKIGKNITDREVPQTSDRFFSEFTTDERRILYDHVVSKTAAVMPELNEFNLAMKPEGQSAPMTREQLMAAERDAKRRRVKHRSAKVHTKSKNYSEVLREVINNQMLAYEDWIKENFGGSSHPESVKPEKNTVEESIQEKQEMIWLEWDFRSNPHTRWKHILEKEKRKEREEKVNDGNGKDVKKNYYERKREREEINSRTYSPRDRYRKREYDDESRDKYHKVSYHEDYRVRDDKERGRHKKHDASYSGETRNVSSRRDNQHSRHREEEKKNEKYKRDGYNKDKSKYREKSESKCDGEYKVKFKKESGDRYDPIEKYSEKSSEYHRDRSNNIRTTTCDEYYGEMKQSGRIKEIKLEDNSHVHVNRSYESVLKKEEAEDTDSDTSRDSSLSSSSSDSRRAKKRKKSKKKHKHRHKKKHRKE